MRIVDFTDRLVGTGWAEATISDGAATARLTASYLKDALGDLLEAVGTLFEGAVEARCSWQEEPGECRWIFHRQGSAVHLRVLSFADVYSNEPDRLGVIVFETQQPLHDLARPVVNGAQSVLDEYGEEEYLTWWVDYPFPTAQLEMLRQRLNRD